MKTAEYNHTPAELERIQQNFLPVRKRHWMLLYSGMGLILIGAFVPLFADSSPAEAFLRIVPGFALVLYARITWRCPVCDGWFDRGWIKGYCPRCGTRLTE